MWHRETAWDSSWPVTSENSTGRHPYLILIHISISIEENSTGRHPYRRPMCSAVQSNSCVDKCLLSSLMKAAMIISSVMHCYFNHYCFQNYNHFQSIQFLHQAHQMYIYACHLFHLWDMYLYPYLYMCISMSVFVCLILWKLSQVFQFCICISNLKSVFATVFSFMKALKRFRHNDCFLLFSDLAPSPFTVAIYWRLLQTRKYIGSD